jgi:hypothetical protein
VEKDQMNQAQMPIHHFLVKIVVKDLTQDKS